MLENLRMPEYRKVKISGRCRQSAGKVCKLQRGKEVRTMSLKRATKSSVGEDIKYQMSLAKRESGETDEHLAIRLYHVQMEVLSANAGRDLVSNDPSDPFQFEKLDATTREGWIQKAKEYK